MKPLLVLVILGAVTYFLVRALQQRGAMSGLPGRSAGPARRASRPIRPAVPPRVVAPDDDEDFLRDLDRRRLNPEEPE